MGILKLPSMLEDLCTRLGVEVCHQDGDSVAQQKISVRCDNLDLADLCLSRQEITAEKHYVPGTLRWETRLGPQENCTDQLYVIKVCQMNLVINDYPRVQQPRNLEHRKTRAKKRRHIVFLYSKETARG